MPDSDPPRAHYDDIEFDDDLGLLNGVPFTGIIHAAHENGQREIEFNYVDGLPSGIQRCWYRNGQLEAEWEAVRGRGSAWSRKWYPNGVMKLERINEKNLPVLIRKWAEDGILTEEINYKASD